MIRSTVQLNLEVRVEICARRFCTRRERERERDWNETERERKRSFDPSPLPVFGPPTPRT